MKSEPGNRPDRKRAAETLSRRDGSNRIRVSSQGNDQIDRIDAALRRLDNGRFGHCLYCGDQISMRRLNRDPAIDSCGTCDEG